MKKILILSLLLIVLVFMAIEIVYIRNDLLANIIYYEKHLKVQTLVNNTKINLGGDIHFLKEQLIRKNAISNVNLKAKIFIIILFKPSDCPSCLIETRIWNKINENYEIKDVCIIGIGNSVTENHLKKFVKSKEIEFPIIYDKGDSLLNSLYINETPLRLVLDNEFKILDIEKPTDKNTVHQNLFKKLDKLLEIY